MSFFLDEIETDLWAYLNGAGKPVVLYGMGDGAEKINAALNAHGLSFADIMASDNFVRGQIFWGAKSKRCRKLKTFTAMIL